MAVAWAHGIVSGKISNVFAPYENISRFQAITMVVRAIDDIDRGLLKNPPTTYKSTWNPSLSRDHGQNARLAEFNGLLALLPLATLDPLAPMARGEIAQLEWNLVAFLDRIDSEEGDPMKRILIATVVIALVLALVATAGFMATGCGGSDKQAKADLSAALTEFETAVANLQKLGATSTVADLKKANDDLARSTTRSSRRPAKFREPM